MEKLLKVSLFLITLSMVISCSKQKEIKPKKIMINENFMGPGSPTVAKAP